MSRLVVISNRLADPRKPAAGGLAVALGEALNQTGGLWFGWSGTVVEGGTPGEGELHTRQAGAVTLATVDLCREDHDSYYHGYSNSVLWPVFHYRLDLADFNASYIAGYRRVNQMFARKLLPLLRDDDVIWVHDYHLIPLAAELRAMGCKQRIGFFLQKSHQKFIQLRRDIFSVEGWRCRYILLTLNMIQDSLFVGLGDEPVSKRLVARQAIVKSDSKREEIGAVVNLFALFHDHLWCHVE